MNIRKEEQATFSIASLTSFIVSFHSMPRIPNLLAEAKSKFPVKILAFCLMPNHFHLVMQPFTNPSLSSFMQWFLTSHVRRYHRIYRNQWPRLARPI